MFDNYYQAVKYLESLANLPKLEYMQAKFRNEFYLKRTQELIKELKINLNQFKFIHLAGTAGKGSTVAMLHSILNQAGKDVGSFYSPHPTTSIERIKVNHKYISADNFAKLMDKVKPVINKMYAEGKYGMPSYFEIFFGLSLMYFQKKKCEYVVLETGCGGEFDATNIIKKPKVCGITNIGLDHTQLLGKSLVKIARTKAGIIKPNSIFVTTEQRPRLLKIFKEICKAKQSQFIELPTKLDGFEKNKVLAAKIAQILKIKEDIINKGIKETHLSCRFEMIQKNPRVILDGAHNYDKLKSTFVNLKKLEFNKLFLIMTLNENKDVGKIIKLVGSQIMGYKKGAEIYITRHLETKWTCADLKIMYNSFPSALKKNIQLLIDPWQALNQVLKKARQNDLILIAGSFYLAGELRQKWISQEKILKANA